MKGYLGARLVATTMGIAAGVLGAESALAQEDWKEEQSVEKLPPDDRPNKKKADAPADDASAKPARFLLDLKLGPAFLLSERGITEFSIQLNAGYAIAHDLVAKGDTFFLTLSPYLLVGENFSVIAPLGVQYDLPLKMIPYKGISAYARVSVGYAYRKPALVGFDQGYHGLAVQPALGVKINFLDRFHFGFEPFGFDVIQTFPPSSTNVPAGTASAFQIYIVGGAQF
jgi:hypothetical protein